VLVQILTYPELGHLLYTPQSPVCVQILTYPGLGHLLDTPHSPVCVRATNPLTGNKVNKTETKGNRVQLSLRLRGI
jgi:hypothetical protein